MLLLERDSQLAALTEYACEAGAGYGRLVLVSGEAGVGKSALVEGLQAELPDAVWCYAACDGLFTPRPLAPVLDLAERCGTELARLGAAGAPRDDLFSGFVRWFAELDRLTVVVIEDVHWADEATLDFVRLVGRRVRSTRALLIVTYRDDGLAADDPVRIAIGELATQATTRRILLPRLTAKAVQALADGSGADAAGVYRLTGGNPYYVTEVLRYGVDPLPASARDAVLARTARLSASAREVVAVAALVGSRVEPDLLDAAAQPPPGAVEELLAAGLVISTGAVLRFRHEIARLAVDQAIPAHQRLRVHRAILDALIAAGSGDDAQLAFHAEGARDTARVLRHAPAAGRHASAVAAHREAAAQYERALRFAGSADVRTRAGLYDAFAYECSLVDRWADSAQARTAAVQLWHNAGDPLREGDSLCYLARAMWRLCRGDEERAAAEAALTVLEPLGPTAELAEAYNFMAVQRAIAFEVDAAVELTDRALALADRLDLPAVASSALNIKGWTLAMAGRPGWNPVLDAAVAVAASAGLHELAGRAYSSQYEAYCAVPDFAAGERYFVEGVAYCDEHDISTYGTCLRGQRVVALARQGRWPEAVELGQRLLQLAGASPVNRVNPLLGVGAVLARQGRPGAWACLDEAVRLADGLADPRLTLAVRLARAEAHWITDNLEAASLELAHAGKVAPRTSAADRAALTEWSLRITGAPPDPSIAQPEPCPSDHVKVARGWDKLGCSYDAALALLDAGDQASLSQALDRLQSLGADAVARLVRRRMRALGMRPARPGPRASTRQHPAGLTAREAQVLDLICAGCTNDDIANHLVVSVRTVDHHVSAVLAKLGVSTRQLAAAEASRRGLVPSAN